MGGQWRIRRSEVLRYLGHAGQAVGSELAGRIESAVARCEGELSPRWVWAVYPVAAGEGRDHRSFEVVGTRLVLAGDSMASYLRGASCVALLACTLGPRSEASLRELGATDPLAQLVYDAACADLVEQGAERAEAEVVAEAGARGLAAGMRYGPGYGDLSLAVQPVLLDVLQAPRRLGLVSTADHLLIPSKSVTAVMGLYPHSDGGAPAGRELLGCEACSLRDGCQIKGRGLRCHGPGRLRRA